MDINKLTKLLKSRGLLCGSRVWGFAHKDSDWDYIIPSETIQECLPPEDVVEIDQLIKKFAAQPSSTGGTHAKYPTPGFNVIIPSTNMNLNVLVTQSDSEYAAWVQCTSEFSGMIGGSDLLYTIFQDKPARIAAFKSLRHLRGLCDREEPDAFVEASAHTLLHKSPIRNNHGPR